MLPNPDDLQSFAAQVFQAVTTSNWRYLACLLIIAVVFFGGRFLEGKLPFFGKPAGKAVLSLLVALLGGLSTAFLAGRVPTGAEILAALGLGWTASGGFSQLKAIYEYFLPAKTE